MRKLMRWGVVASLAFAATGVVVGCPIVAAADALDRGSTAEAPAVCAQDLRYELPIIAGCDQCGGLMHQLSWSANDDVNFFYSTAGIDNFYLFDDADLAIEDAVSSNPDVVSTWVGQFEGYDTVFISGQSVGTATVTATAEDGQTAELSVTVKDVSDNPLAMEHAPHYGTITGVEVEHPLDGTTFDLAKLSEYDESDLLVYATWLPEREDGVSYYGRISIESSDPSVVSVENEYYLMPREVGSATITVSLVDYAHGEKVFKDSVTVNVIDTTTEEGGKPEKPEEGGKPEGIQIPNRDAESGASVSVTPANPNNAKAWEDVTFVSEHKGGAEMDRAWNALLASVDGVKGGGYVYDLHFESPDGSVFEIPEGDSVKVTLPIPAGMGFENVHVFHVADDGTVTDMGAIIDPETRTVTFTTSHFSTFVIAQVDESSDGSGTGESGGASKPAAKGGLPQTGDAAAATFVGIALMGTACAVGGTALQRRRGSR